MKKVEGQKEVWRDKVHEFGGFWLIYASTTDTRHPPSRHVCICRCGACEVESNKTSLFYGSLMWYVIHTGLGKLPDKN